MPRPINVYSREELRTLTSEEFSAYEAQISLIQDMISAVKAYREASAEATQRL
jgi:hypothetical protein